MAYNRKHFHPWCLCARKKVRFLNLDCCCCDRYFEFFSLLLWHNTSSLQYSTAQKLNIFKSESQATIHDGSTISIRLSENIAKVCTIDTISVYVHTINTRTHALPLQFPHGILVLERGAIHMHMHTHTFSRYTPTRRRIITDTRMDSNTQKYCVYNTFDLAVWLAYYTHANVVPSVEKVPLKISSICFESGRRKQRWREKTEQFVRVWYMYSFLMPVLLFLSVPLLFCLIFWIFECLENSDSISSAVPRLYVWMWIVDVGQPSCMGMWMWM